ncbi:MAG: hypothetical protein LBG64_02900 [Pseudomonadales bacterium]|jgi:hypothetical protein|nr:hypothetical protein [Pseudomonadales bacterium]
MKKILRINFKLALFALLIVLSGQLSIISVLAQGANLQISPTSNYVWVPGGHVGLTHFMLTNLSFEPVMVSIEARSFVADLDGAPQLLSELDFPFLYRLEVESGSTESADLDQVVRYDLSQAFLIEPQSTRNVWIGIEPPIGIDEREYPISLLFTAQAHGGVTSAAGSVVGAAVGGNLVVLVADNNSDRSQLNIVETRFPFFIDSFFGRDFSALIANEGATGTIINGNMQLIQNGLLVVDEWEFAHDLVLSGAQRFARADARIDQMDRPNLSTNWRPQQFLFGAYDLVINVRSAHPQSEVGYVSTTISFYAFPYFLTLVVLAIILFGVAIKMLTKKNQRQIKLKKDASSKFAQMSKQNKAFKADKS